MLHPSRFSVASFFSAVVLSTMVRAQAPRGWIQDNAWLMLGPLGNATGCDPGAGANQNWIAPLDIATITPGANDPAEIDFGPAASTSWEGLGDEPVWLSLEEQGFSGNDLIDMLTITTGLAANSGEIVPAENMMAVFVTYVSYSGAQPIVVNLCDSSDDSVQIWVNNGAVRTVNSCRGTAGSCSEVTPVVLYPGKNAIKVLLWQGTGGWSFRLRLSRQEGSAITDADPEFSFDFDAGATASLSNAFVTRTASTPGFPECAAVGDLTVSLKGDGSAGPSTTLVEKVFGAVEVFDVSNGGVFAPTSLPASKNPVGIFEDHRSVGGGCIDGDTVDLGGGSYTVTGAGTDIWVNGDEFEFAYKEVSGDFSLSARVTDKVWAPGSRWGKVGIMARQDLDRSSRYTMMQTHGEDEQDADRMAGRRTHGAADNYEIALATAGEHREFQRLSRAGSVFTVETSIDGITWEVLGTQDWGPGTPQTVLLGLAVCAHSEADGGCVPASITFDEVTLTGGDDPRIPDPRKGGTITWAGVSRDAVNAGLSYKIRGDTVARFSGHDSEHTVQGDQSAAVATGANSQGIFDTAHDLGAPCITGQTIYDAGDGSYSVTGGGIDIWQTGDQFQYAYKKVTGNFSLVAHVRERIWAPGSRWGKVGIMARQDCSSRSRYAMMQTHGEDQQDYDRFAARPTHGGADNFEASNLTGNMHRDWMRLDRIGNLFIGSFSEDGTNWTQAATMTWGAGAPATILLGLAVCAHSDTAGGCNPATIVFDEVTFSVPSFTVKRETGTADACPSESETQKVLLVGEGDAGPPIPLVETVTGNVQISEISNLGRAKQIPEPTQLNPLGLWEDVRDIGEPCTPGTTTEDAPDTYTVTGSGTDIWQQGDQFEYAYRRVTGDFMLTAHVQERVWAPGTRWGKVGIMARENHGARSRYSMIQTHGEDLQDADRFAGRRTSGSDDNFEATTLAAGEHRDWMRLERVGDAFNSYMSIDGVDWQPVGGMNWGEDAPQTVLLGLAVCAHGDGCQSSSITFDEVELTGGGGPHQPLAPQGYTISWNVGRSALLNPGVSYRVSGKGFARVTGVADGLAISGPASVLLTRIQSSDLGELTQAHDIGNPCVTGDTTYDAGDQSYTVTGGGFDIWQGGDQFQYAYKRWNGDFSVVAHVRDRIWAPGSRWGKVGIMAREDCSSRSRYAMIQTHGEDLQDADRFAARPVTDGTNNYEVTTLAGGEHRDWMRLDREGNLFTAYVSETGGEWEAIAQADWGEGAPTEVLLGLAVCAHSDQQSGCEPTTITFDNLKIATSFVDEGVKFHRGDADDNGSLQLTDAIRVLGFLFLGQAPPTCMDAADADDNGVLQLTDAVRILGFLFLGQAPPSPPGPPDQPCGIDPVLEEPDLGCESYTRC